MASTLDHTKLKFKLNTGDEIPAIGLGTSPSPKTHVANKSPL
jgi:hypothetical protein